MYYLTVQEAKNQTWVSLVQNLGVSRAAFLSGASRGETFSTFYRLPTFLGLWPLPLSKTGMMG